MNYENLNIPNHIAIILDGNGRWAKASGLSRLEGHDAGFDRAEEIAEYAFDKGVKVLSLFAFSTENFKRSKEEVDHLMEIFVSMFHTKFQKIVDKGVKIVISGSRDNLSEEVIKSIEEMTEKTKNNKNGILNICINYGGRLELVDTYKKLIKLNIKEENVTEEVIKENLYNNLPDVDLLIRTSGEQRLSNFMLYLLAYSEFYFPEIHWPDFTKEEFDKAIMIYNQRNRRFGKES